MDHRSQLDGVSADPASRPIGEVIAISGSQAGIRLGPSGSAGAVIGHGATVGSFIGILTSNSTVVGVLTSVKAEGGAGPDRTPTVTCQMDVLGEIKAAADGVRGYRRGVTTYPVIGGPVVPLSTDDLRTIFDDPREATIRVGSIHQDATIGAHIKVDDMLAKHFAVLGTTGVGKSSAVAVIMREVLAAKPDLRIFFVDPHNEYGGCFADRAEVLNPRNLRLPFWLFNFEEFVDVLFRGRPGLEEETEILSEVIPAAKSMFSAGRSSADRSPVRRADAKSTGYHVDTPVPYRLVDLIGLIEERRGKLDNRSSAANYNRLLTRIDTVRNDPRYAFMFDNANVGGDTMPDVLIQLFRLGSVDRPMTVMQLAGFPAEVVDSVVSVLCRMAFEFGQWSDGAAPILLVCEEAHRYAPGDRSVGFGPTRKALSRIAKEGRKYGVFLGLVSQRPAELDQTIVSQCSTVFAMRMANDRDQAILRAAVSDAAATLLSFIPALGTREAFGFGEGMSLPTRIRFNELPPHLIPRAEAASFERLQKSGLDRHAVASIVERWRGASTSRPKVDDAPTAGPVALTKPALPQPGDVPIQAQTAQSMQAGLADIARRSFGGRLGT